MHQSLTKFTENFTGELDEIVDRLDPDNIFILTDHNTELYCLPALMRSDRIKKSKLISIEQGDESKNIDTTIKIWQFLTENKASRKSLMINLGGGMITDLGGFAASTFKRGMPYVNISTTLLGAVDAATGGKTGINFLGLKNEIGIFSPAEAVLINPAFFKTLDAKNLRSGFAEVIKHALISSYEEWNLCLAFDLEDINFDVLKNLTSKSILIKEKIVEQDPKEQNIRKALNFGHTIGHAIESMSYKTNSPLLHGYAVAWGMICELYISHIKLNFPKEELLKYLYWVKEYYGSCMINCKQYEDLYRLMQHDKKNESDQINFTLLKNIGEVEINQTATKEKIFESLDFLRES